jgi:hypothetical protein
MSVEGNIFHVPTNLNFTKIVNDLLGFSFMLGSFSPLVS